MQLDLTDVGFTPTESAVYRALGELGPVTGYVVAKALSIARANAYQALNGLVAKGGAMRVGGRPERFRPVQPMALFSAIAQRMAARLDTLEAALAHQPASGAPATIPVAGRRGVVDVAMRTAARSEGIAICVAPAQLLAALAPAWHKRGAAGWVTELWCLGEPASERNVPALTGQIEMSTLSPFFAAPIFALTTPDAAVLAQFGSTDLGSGFWTSDPVLVGAVRAALRHLTGEPQAG